jgi:hypothetical protein
MDRFFCSHPRFETVRLNVDAAYAARSGMLSRMSLFLGAGMPTCLGMRDCPVVYLPRRSRPTHSYDPLTHSDPQAMSTPVLPLRMSPCPPTRFNPPCVSLISDSVFCDASAKSSCGMGRPFEMMSDAPFCTIVTFCKALANRGQSSSVGTASSTCWCQLDIARCGPTMA